MPVEVTVPRLGWSMDEGTFAEWLIPDGGQVSKGDLLYVLEGDKAAQEIESFDEGRLKLLSTSPRSGDKVRVGQVLAVLLAPGETYSPASPPDPSTTRQTQNAAEVSPSSSAHTSPGTAGRSQETTIGDPPAGPASRRRARELGVNLSGIMGSGDGGRITVDDVEHAAKGRVATPRARRQARELGIDWRLVTGSGRGGRVRERDVISWSQQNSTATRRSETDQWLNLSSSRQVIARRMLESHLQKAPVTLNTTADMTNLVSLREQFRQMTVADTSTTKAAVPSFNDLFAKLTAAVLRIHPQLNSTWDDSSGTAAIRLYGNINVGIAVDTDSGLLVPVVSEVDQKSLRQVASESARLIDRARNGRLTASELSGGTFTITNLGSLGIDNFTPVINGAQCAILGIGRIRRQPIWLENQFVPRDVVSLSLTFDHRIVDGAPAARFLQSLVQALESPAAFLID